MMSSQTLFGQAMALFQRGALAEAESLLARILSADPKAFAPRHMLGLVLAQQGRLAEARETIAAALEP
jgi:Flp pilus assembly protein TadD